MIRSIEVIPLHLPVAQTLTLSRGVATDPSAGAPHILVRIIDHDGITGWGEARPSHRWSYETEETVVTTIRKYLAPVLVNEDERDLARTACADGCDDRSRHADRTAHREVGRGHGTA